VPAGRGGGGGKIARQPLPAGAKKRGAQRDRPWALLQGDGARKARQPFVAILRDQRAAGLLHAEAIWREKAAWAA
jgi:hypothetical protein